MIRTMLTLVAAAVVAAVPASANDLAITNVTVVDVERGSLLPDRTVVIDGDRIVTVDPASSTASGVQQVLDGRGKFLIPGLVDMHVHFAPVPGEPGDDAARAAAVMLAHGVTTARSMIGHPAHIALRDAIERGAIPGPRIYLASSPLSENRTKSPEEAREAIRAAKAGGFDFVKMHGVTDAATWQAAQDEARLLGLATAGHVTGPVGLERAFAAGQQVEHLDGFPHALLQAGSDITFGQIPPAEAVAAIDAGALAGHPIFARARAAGSYQVPTLSLFEKLLTVDLTAEQLAARPEMRFVSAAAVSQWTQQRAGLTSSITPSHGANVIALRRAMVGALAAEGVPLMAGSDTAQAFHVWGAALLEEINALAKVVGPAAALRAATATPADYFVSLPGRGSALGWASDFGRIAAGKRADAVLLNANPLADLSALDRPAAVIVRGKLLDRAALDAMLAEAERQARAAD